MRFGLVVEASRWRITFRRAQIQPLTAEERGRRDAREWAAIFAAGERLSVREDEAGHMFWPGDAGEPRPRQTIPDDVLLGKGVYVTEEERAEALAISAHFFKYGSAPDWAVPPKKRKSSR